MRARAIVRLLTATAAALLAATVATPASASGNSAGDYYQPPTPYVDSGEFDPECEGLDLTVQFRARGVESLRNVRGSDGQAFLVSNEGRYREVWIDDSTGDVVLTARGSYDFEEISARRVPKSSVPEDLIPPEGLVGPIYWFKVVDEVRDVVRDADGDVLARGSGTTVARVLFDTLGDSQPGGTELSVEEIRVIGSPLDVDLCDLAAAQLD
jgi:hypothetical protein